ncbi:uncharacterized protein B0H18DRAFT_689691 [Fomitopsis serialis]|uniref:uncharacterized protein n=1 Tax=Fomitopsis serialis TaxID=139415 RepID=UPI0020083F10|nr:uncharacterized protein B0H18DRAFT_689691 [Neoantrodia serialis]KAH9917737.1 hypothetical protein B0H18DRAFT_689691 [Neoantrodia serialis]
MAMAVHRQSFSTTIISNASGESEVDGAVYSAVVNNKFSTVTALTKIALEVGEGVCEPLAQVKCAYVALYPSDEARPVRQACCCPAFLIGMAGPNIIVSGAVFADQLIAQTLTDYISVVPRPGKRGRSPLDDAGHRVARLFRALKVCIEDLNRYYKQVAQEVAPPPPPPVTGVMGSCASVSESARVAQAMRVPSYIGPHFTEYLDSAGQSIELVYKERLSPDITGRAVIVAEARREAETETTPTKVVVKFAHTYNREAHELLAAAEPPQAPRLRHCAYEDSVGMWVVVMDYVEGSKLGEVQTEPTHVASLRTAVRTLHERGFVFGDLRQRNVLVVGERVVLIDFDWCRKAGEARYPSDILLDGQIPWHYSVRRGGLIEEVHDRHLFHILTGEEL